MAPNSFTEAEKEIIEAHIDIKRGSIFLRPLTERKEVARQNLEAARILEKNGDKAGAERLKDFATKLLSYDSAE